MSQFVFYTVKFDDSMKLIMVNTNNGAYDLLVTSMSFVNIKKTFCGLIERFQTARLYLKKFLAVKSWEQVKRPISRSKFILVRLSPKTFDNCVLTKLR